MKTSISVLLLFIFLPVFSQESQIYTIWVHEIASARIEKEKLEFIRGKNESLLVSHLQKNKPLFLNKKDSLRILTLMRNLSRESKDELISIVEKTKVYEIDSVQIPKDDPILKIADSFFQNRKGLVQQHEKKEDNRIILDGALYKITIADVNGSYSFYTRSPNKELYPEIHELVSALRKTRCNPVE